MIAAQYMQWNPLYSGHLYNQDTFWSPKSSFSVQNYLWNEDT